MKKDENNKSNNNKNSKQKLLKTIVTMQHQHQQQKQQQQQQKQSDDSNIQYLNYHFNNNDDNYDIDNRNNLLMNNNDHTNHHHHLISHHQHSNMVYYEQNNLLIKQEYNSNCFIYHNNNDTNYQNFATTMNPTSNVNSTKSSVHTEELHGDQFRNILQNLQPPSTTLNIEFLPIEENFEQFCPEQQQVYNQNCCSYFSTTPTSSNDVDQYSDYNHHYPHHQQQQIDPITSNNDNQLQFNDESNRCMTNEYDGSNHHQQPQYSHTSHSFDHPYNDYGTLNSDNTNAYNNTTDTTYWPSMVNHHHHHQHQNDEQNFTMTNPYYPTISYPKDYDYSTYFHHQINNKNGDNQEFNNYSISSNNHHYQDNINAYDPNEMFR
ncbi:hypothetical protein HUG17_1307 [Dermatophagoides farinae]|nr:hypothetical protein HUG17_1307 [Dermatophagoides farinae]